MKDELNRKKGVKNGYKACNSFILNFLTVFQWIKKAFDKFFNNFKKRSIIVILMPFVCLVKFIRLLRSC